MSGTNRIYYWDACIYLAWLKGEQIHGKIHVDAIAAIARDNADRKNVIITSTITLIEVLESKLTAQQEDQFRRSFKSPVHILYDVDPPIAQKAREFRDRLIKNGGKGIAVADAIHLATAAIYESDEFHTFDDGQKDKKRYSLLELNGDARIDKRVICKPTIEQRELFSPSPTQNPPPEARA